MPKTEAVVGVLFAASCIAIVMLLFLGMALYVMCEATTVEELMCLRARDAAKYELGQSPVVPRFDGDNCTITLFLDGFHEGDSVLEVSVTGLDASAKSFSTEVTTVALNGERSLKLHQIGSAESHTEKYRFVPRLLLRAGDVLCLEIVVKWSVGELSLSERFQCKLEVTPVRFKVPVL